MFRRVVLLLLLAALFTTPASSGAPARCTINGGRHVNFLTGNARDNVICGHGGRDFLSGMGGNDRLRGGPGPDTLIGGPGRDVLRGGRGIDRLFAVDGHGGDVLWSQDHRDLCFGEKHDHFRHCLQVYTNGSPEYPLAVVHGYSGALQNTISVAGHAPPCNDDPGCGNP